MTIFDLSGDPRKLAEFMGWEWTRLGDVRPVYKCYGHTGHGRTVYEREEFATAAEQIADRFRRWLFAKRVTEAPRPLPWSSIIRECAREEFGIKGRTAREVQEKCLARYPEIYARHPEPAKAPVEAVSAS
jgi:hypothetical protein